MSAQTSRGRNAFLRLPSATTRAGDVGDGYAGRRPQLVARTLRSPVGQRGFLDVDHVCDHVATLRVNDGHPGVLHYGAAAIFDEDRQRLLARIHGAHATILSASAGLLAYQFGSPRRWRVIHTRSGVSPAYLEAPGTAPWTRLRYHQVDDLDLPAATITGYLAGLEGIPSVDGRVVDWTTDLTSLTYQLRRWRDTSDVGRPARQGTLYTGMTGLHLAALFHAITPGSPGGGVQ